MSETRKNHLNIDGGQVKEDEHIASYKPLPDSDKGFRNAKVNLTKSKEKVSDEAEEKLLGKEDEVKITPTARVDMDAKYVVESYTNGDAKIELDASKRQFTGLTKEELLKYADDPFWVRLRWFMFLLFWALWLCMLAGAIVIIVRAPKCPPPAPRTWYQRGPLVEMSETGFAEIESQLALMKSAEVQGIFATCPETYVADEPGRLDSFKDFIKKTKDYGVKVIVDLTANFVSDKHSWFVSARANRSSPYSDYFVWSKTNGSDASASLVAGGDGSAWAFSEERQEYYLHHFGAEWPDLDFGNPRVEAEFAAALKTWMGAGADGVRLVHARNLVLTYGRTGKINSTNSTLPDGSSTNSSTNGSSTNSSTNGSSTNSSTNGSTTNSSSTNRSLPDMPTLRGLLQRWADLVDEIGDAPGAGETVFTVKETQEAADASYTWTLPLRPGAASPLRVAAPAPRLARELARRLGAWPLLQLVLQQEPGAEVEEEEVTAFSLLLPAAPVLAARQLARAGNASVLSDSISRLVELRRDASVEHGDYDVRAVPAPDNGTAVVACARWKPGHTGYVALLNLGAAEARADLRALRSVPAALTVHHASKAARLRTNATLEDSMDSDQVLVPGFSSLILSYVPKTEEAN